MTKSQCYHPIMQCLWTGENFIENESKFTGWIANNNKQEELLEFMNLGGDWKNIKEIESIADHNTGVINKFLKERGFDIQLPVGNVKLAVASVLDLLLNWKYKGVEDVITDNLDDEYPAVLMNDDGVYFRQTSFGEVITIETTEWDQRVNIIIPQIEPINLYDYIKEVQNEVYKVHMTKATTLKFPMIDYDEKVDIHWVEGLVTDDNKYMVDTALQQTRFRMNEVGAKVESAVVMGISGSLCIEPLLRDIVIKEPFVLWVERRKLKLPLFAGYFEQNVWEKPIKS